MNALSLPLATRPLAAARRPSADCALDLRGSRIRIETDRGLVDAHYLDAKPRRDAVVIPLGAGQWMRGEPVPEAVRHARLLLQSGVSVLIVDTRSCEGWRARLLRRSRETVVRAALDYLVARGHEESDCVVDGRSVRPAIAQR